VRHFVASVIAMLGSALTVISPTPAAISSWSTPHSTFSVVQMNLCLSGHAECYTRANRAGVLAEAALQIDDQQPAAVTINEACRADAAELAGRTGYTVTFAAVDTEGAPLSCINPRGRGGYGIAVLTKDSVTSSHDAAFAGQAGLEERRWLCARTSTALTVCTAHLSTRTTPGEELTNDSECRELRRVLARHQETTITLFAGDLNRQSPCAPADMWVVRDTTASQSSGLQHIYGSSALVEPSASVVRATHTDHDFLLAAASTSGSGFAGVVRASL
jgi:endonuclease/exonuclease/phosphatase family metal-dependent hydrolase